MNYDYYMKNFYCNLYPNSEHVKGIYQGYVVYASIARATGREIALINPDAEYFIYGIIDDYLHNPVKGIIRIESGKITGFHPMSVFEL